MLFVEDLLAEEVFFLETFPPNTASPLLPYLSMYRRHPQRSLLDRQESWEPWRKEYLHLMELISWVYNTTTNLRAAPAVLSMWPSKRKLVEEKSKHASLAQQNGFGPAFFHRMLRLVKGTSEPNTCWLAILFDWSKWVAISSLPPVGSPSFSLMGRVGKKSK